MFSWILWVRQGEQPWCCWHWICSLGTLWSTISLLLKIEIVDIPMKLVIFHRFLYVCQRVTIDMSNMWLEEVWAGWNPEILGVLGGSRWKARTGTTLRVPGQSYWWRQQLGLWNDPFAPTKRLEKSLSCFPVFRTRTWHIPQKNSTKNRWVVELFRRRVSLCLVGSVRVTRHLSFPGKPSPRDQRWVGNGIPTWCRKRHRPLIADVAKIFRV